MQVQAIAICRVSSKEQLLSNSLDLQIVNVEAMAEKLGVPIIKKWALNTSSKKGKNLKRKDLIEAKNLCKQDKRIKYILLDRVNRLGREAKYLTRYMLELELDHDVQLIFCDPSQQSLNGSDSRTFVKRVEKLVEAETENEEKASLAIERMRSRVKLGYYPFNVHPGYKKTDEANGLHVPHEPYFSIIKNGCKLIIYKNYTPSQAVIWMNNNGYRTRAGNKLDTNHFIDFISDTYYCGHLNIKSPGWPENIRGLHIQLLSVREHHQLISILKKRRPNTRYVHNPEFMLGNLLRHKECEGLGGYEKFTGHFRNPGKTSKGIQRPLEPVYDCRDCRKRIVRWKVHESFSEYLKSIEFVPSREKFQKALLKVWKNQRGSVTQRLVSLSANKSLIENKIHATAESFVLENNKVIKNNLRRLLKVYDEQLKDIELEIQETNNTNLESEEFVNFAINFVDNIREKWWSLTWENMKWGEQILFNEKIYMDNDGKVHPTKLSSIYRLGSNKKALSELDNAHLVELAGTAPASDW